MIKSRYKEIEIAGLSVAVPMTWQSLRELVETEKPDDFNLQKFTKMTGVQGRYFASERQTASDFCYAAAKDLMQKFETGIDEIGAIIFVSQCADYTTPATACVLQHRLGGGGALRDCITFDINLGCSGFVYGLNAVAGLMTNSNIDKALLMCGDTYAKAYSHKGDDRTSHSSKYLFGDAGMAMLLEKTNDDKEINIVSCSDGSGFSSIIEPYNHWRHPDKKRLSILDDIEVFNFSTTEAPVMLNEYMEEMGTKPDDYDALLLHQANLFIMKQIAKRTGFPIEKLGISIDTFGNTSSVSIPATLVKMYGEDESTEEKHFLACGYGVGLSWAACELHLKPAQILPLVQTDEYFDDGFED